MVEDMGDYYLIHRFNGDWYTQRKRVLASIHDPLTHHEHVIVELCRGILDKDEL